MLRRFGQCLTWHITLWLGVALAGLPFSATADVRKAFPVLRPALTVFTDREGLPQNTVGAMACDAQGHLWVGTQDGLARYDGRGWQVVVLPAEAASHNIHALLPASDGALWVGTLDGLLRLQRGQWTVFGAGQASEAGFRSVKCTTCLRKPRPRGRLYGPAAMEALRASSAAVGSGCPSGPSFPR